MMSDERCPKGGWRRVRDSCTVMVVYFKDGNRIHRYSDDWASKYAPYKDNALGLSKLEKLLASYGNNPKTVLFINKATNQEFRRIVNGVEVEI